MFAHRLFRFCSPNFVVANASVRPFSPEPFLVSVGTTAISDGNIECLAQQLEVLAQGRISLLVPRAATGAVAAAHVRYLPASSRPSPYPEHHLELDERVQQPIINPPSVSDVVQIADCTFDNNDRDASVLCKLSPLDRQRLLHLRTYEPDKSRATALGTKAHTRESLLEELELRAIQLPRAKNTMNRADLGVLCMEARSDSTRAVVLQPRRKPKRSAAKMKLAGLPFLLVLLSPLGADLLARHHTCFTPVVHVRFAVFSPCHNCTPQP